MQAELQRTTSLVIERQMPMALRAALKAKDGAAAALVKTPAGGSAVEGSGGSAVGAEAAHGLQ